MVGRGRVAQVDAARRGIRHLRLERHDAHCFATGDARLLSGQREDLRDVIHIGGAQRIGRRPLIRVIVSIGEAKTALHEPHDVVRRVMGIGQGCVRKDSVTAVHLHLGDLRQ